MKKYAREITEKQAFLQDYVSGFSISIGSFRSAAFRSQSAQSFQPTSGKSYQSGKSWFRLRISLHPAGMNAYDVCAGREIIVSEQILHAHHHLGRINNVEQHAGFFEKIFEKL